MEITTQEVVILTNDSSPEENITAQPTDEARSRSSSQPNSTTSYTSTVEYGQEAFETYQLRVRELCLSLWPDSPRRSRLNRVLGNRVAELFHGQKFLQSTFPTRPKEFLIERLQGGSYNRVIGITIVDSRSASPTQLILRVPRFDDAKPERDLAPLHYIGQHSSIPVAKIHSSDFTDKNPLKSPYVIQHRIAGNDLQRSSSKLDFPQLNFAQQRTVAKEVGKVLSMLHATSNASPGRIEAVQSTNGTYAFTIRPFEVKLDPFEDDSELDDASHATVAPLYESTLEFFESQFTRWRIAAEGVSDIKILFMNRLAAAASQMHAAGYLGDQKNSLCHLDLNGAPRNIMADINKDKSLKITGILDWDDAIFAPQFIGCAPPFWLWAWPAWTKDAEDESVASETPTTPEQRELKRVWEEAVGPEFLRYTYKPEYRLARQLLPWALNGIHSNWEMKAADAFLNAWAAIRPEGTQRIGRVFRSDPDSYSLESDDNLQSSNDYEGDETLEELEVDKPEAVEEPETVEDKVDRSNLA